MIPMVKREASSDPGWSAPAAELPASRVQSNPSENRAAMRRAAPSDEAGDLIPEVRDAVRGELGRCAGRAAVDPGTSHRLEETAAKRPGDERRGLTGVPGELEGSPGRCAGQDFRVQGIAGSGRRPKAGSLFVRRQQAVEA